MELPASYYGSIDSKNPVVIAFERDICSCLTLLRRAASSTCQDNGSYAKGIKSLVALWIKYKPRLPSKLYLEHMLKTADALTELKLYQPALWHGYHLYLLHFSSVNIMNITDIDQFMVCYFPEGFDADQDILAMKIRAMLGCALCILEQEKRPSVLSHNGLCKLLRVLNFIRIMMQAFQQHEQLCWHIYNGSLQIYNICRYLMTMNCSAQALEYLLWTSISVELCFPLMTAKYLPWIVTLYCAVCHCYYDNQSSEQAEHFARRALGKINELAKLDDQRKASANKETQNVYKEAAIKLGAMVFKRTVFETRRKSKFKIKPKNNLKDLHITPWPHTTTGRMLCTLFESSAACFFSILEALWDSTSLPLKTSFPEEPELQEVILELLSAGIGILSGVTSSEPKCDDCASTSIKAVTATSTLIDLAIAGESKIPITSAVRFIKLLFHYKQPETFTELAREMLEVLSGVEGQSFRKAEQELFLLYTFNNLLYSQRKRPRDYNMADDKHNTLFLRSDDFNGLVEALHKSVCGSAPDVKPERDLVLEIVLFLWGKLKLVKWRENPKITDSTEKAVYYKWLWCLCMLWDIANACDLATVDCIITAEMIHMLAKQLESAAEHCEQTHPGASEADVGGVKPGYPSLLRWSRTELLQKESEVVEQGLKCLSKGLSTLLPEDSSVSVIDYAFILKEETEGAATKTGSGSKDTLPKALLLALDLYLELDIIRHRVSLKLLQLNSAVESELFGRIKRNKVSKALFLIQRALIVYSNMEANNSSQIKSLLEEASSLIEKAEVEERKLYFSTTRKIPGQSRDTAMKDQEELPPAPPILLSRTDQSFSFAPAPYILEEKVCWYQLCGCAVEGIKRKVRLGDCNLLGTGKMVPAKSGECILKVEGLEPNQKYMFAIAAYNSQGKLLGNNIGETTFPLLASFPVPLLSAWAHLAQVAFQTVQYAVAKRACRELWRHYTVSDPGTHCIEDRLGARGLHQETLKRSSPQLCQLFLTSIFIQTEINIQQESLYYSSFSDKGPFIWEQEARLAECERMLVAVDLALWLNDGFAAIQAVVTCYGLLAPLIFHQINCDALVQVLKKCLVVLEANSDLLKQQWTGMTLDSLMHMIACITYYLSKSLRTLRDHHVASVVMDCGRKLLQEVHDAQLQISRPVSATESLKALQAKNKKITSEATLSTNTEVTRPVTGSMNPTILYDLISSSSLKDAYQNVMKLRHKAYFIEYAALLLQRTKEEGHVDLVLEWGQSMLKFLCRRDEVMGLLTRDIEKENSVQALKENEPHQNRNISHNDARKKVKQKLPHSLLQAVRTNREMLIVENLLDKMSSVVHRSKKRLQLRKLCKEESVWRSHLNYTMAQAHIALLHQGLDKLHGETLQDKYSQLNPLCFSLAYSGILVWRNLQRQQSSNIERDSQRSTANSLLSDYVPVHRDEVRIDDSATEDSCDEEQDSAQLVKGHNELHRHTVTLVHKSLNKAGLHFRRAMVLAHRGSHWTTLQYVCQNVWEQSCRLALFAQRAAELEPPCVTTDQLQTFFMPLLTLATDLIMDMLNRLGFWSVYDSNLTEEELETGLQFSALLDDSTQVDLRWVHTLVLHTLEQLHFSGKWESLAHFALLYNSYTRERYALIITPLLIHAQRMLLERISFYGGPSVPQPHHVKTQMATGKDVTCRNYAWCQLLSGWTLTHAKQPHIRKKSANSSTQNVVELKGAEVKLSMANVCVPLDTVETQKCYHQAIERRSHCMQVFQHSRSLLMRLLAYTQPSFEVHLRHGTCFSNSTSLVGFSPIVMPAPNSQPCDMTAEDFSTANAFYSLPISPDHLPTVIAAYFTSIKHLKANSHDSLRVLALHEMGNLQFYTGNMRAAQSHWSNAVDCALKNTGTVEKWDGVTSGSGCLQQTLQQAGIWGCLQAAVLTAKIAQYILTSDVSQRTKCCLLSAHLFKCVLYCSMAQPQTDLQYASHSIREELLPGVNLFSEPLRVHLETTVTSLNFVCHWLFTTGYHITLLPILALYLHFVGTLCRDVKRTVEGKILQIRALTELCLFTEAVKEAVQLTQGLGVLLPCGYGIATDSLQPMKIFYSNKSLLDNAEALEELLNCNIGPEIRTLYGSQLCLRFNLTRIQLVLALSNTVHGLPVQDDDEGECCGSKTVPKNSAPHEQDRLDVEGSYMKADETKVLDFKSRTESLSPERIKLLLLEAASSLINSSSQQLTACCCSEMESIELAVEFKLLKANLYYQQGHIALSSETAASSLVLLQTSPVITRQKPASESLHHRSRSKQDLKDCSMSLPLPLDCPREVEVRERTGVLLWLRCRRALVHSLIANIPANAALLPGKNFNDEAARLIQEALGECVQWGDLDIRACLMVEGAELEAQRGRTDDSITMLQEAVSLLVERSWMPPGSILTLARAALLLSNLRGNQSTTLLKLTKELLQKQLRVFGQNVELNDGEMCFSPPGLTNIYLPYLKMLAQMSMR
ncbi:cilia- and flagella-associated protein 54-like isoform X2 [Betta splendens]|nr:cilia- and flagella-associated protein 54-like isoform X2 [Betta splendens]